MWLNITSLCLWGFFDPGEHVSFAGKYKWLWETNNKCSNMVTSILDRLVDLGILEYNDQEMQFRWNSNYKMSEQSVTWKNTDDYN